MGNIMKGLAVKLASINKSNSSIRKMFFRIFGVSLVLTIITLFVFYPVQELTDTMLRIGLTIYQALNYVMGISLFLAIFIPTIKYLSEEYVKDNIDKEIMEMLPGKLLSDYTWIHIAQAIINARKIMGYSHNDMKYRGSKLITYKYNLLGNRPRHLFGYTYMDKLKGGHTPETVKKLEKENDIYSYMWLSELRRSPLLERIAVLYRIDTEEKQRTFANRPIEELEEFFLPLDNFFEFVKDNRTSVELQREMHKKKIESAKEQRMKDEMDELFKLGMSRLDQIQEVHAPSHPLD